MSQRRLQVGSVYKLVQTGTVVFVEALSQTAARVVALPEQPSDRDQNDRVFCPGAVRGKAVSPHLECERIDVITERNQAFIDNFRVLRASRGIDHVDRTPEEIAAAEAVAQAAAAPKRSKHIGKTDTDEPRPERRKRGDKTPKEPKLSKREQRDGLYYQLDPTKTLPDKALWKEKNRGWLVVESMKVHSCKATIVEVGETLAADPRFRSKQPALKLARKYIFRLMKTGQVTRCADAAKVEAAV